MNIKEYLDKNNLHHAYLIEGMRDEIVPEITGFLNDIGIKTEGSADFIHISLDSFKIDDARNLKSYGTEKGFSSAKKIFVISTNSILLEAQNSLLKMFEEPIENTHFFVIVPDTNALLRTLVSRFYLISPKSDLGEREKEAERFIKMPLRDRIDFMKELLAESEEEDEEGNEIVVLDSTRSKALKFLNALESVLHKKFLKSSPLRNSANYFEHIFKVREFLRMPGSSAKSLMESVALVIPSFSN